MELKSLLYNALWASLFLTFATSWLAAEPIRYNLDQNASRVSFSFNFGEQRSKGFFPVESADVILDLDRLANSKVSVELSISKARAGDIVSTSAMKSDDVLNADQFPTARFQSTSVKRNGQGAIVNGQLSLRGVTRSIALDARLIRTPDAPKDNSQLVMEISGDLLRSDFGATGFGNLVGDKITLKFFIWLNRA